jgi:hypothetical protein
VDDPTVVREALREAAPNVVTQSVAFDGVSSYDEIWRSACGEGGCNFFLKSGSGEVYRRIWFRWDHVGLLGLSLFDATPEEAAASRRGT